MSVFPRSPRLRRWLALFVIVFGMSLAIVRANVQTYSESNQTILAYPDIELYIAMMRGEQHHSWAFRPVIPFLARQVPGISPSFFSTLRQTDERFVAAMKFAVLNLLFLTAASALLFRLARRLGLHLLVAFLVPILFLGSSTVVRGGGLPMTDTGFFFFLALAALGLVEENVWLVGIAAFIGMFTKETMVLVLPMALLLPIPWRRRALLVSPIALAIAAYAFALSRHPETYAHLSSVAEFRYAPVVLGQLSRPNGWVNVFLAFGLAWLPALYALRKPHVPAVLKRWMWLAPVVFVAATLEGANLSRAMFGLFPIVIPLAAFGLAAFMGSDVSNQTHARVPTE